jgi:hypothetical protein
MPTRFPLVASLFIALPFGAMAQTYVDLDFSHNVQAAAQMYPNNSTLGPYFHSGSFMEFTNAGSYNGSSVDVRVSFIGLTSGESSDFRDTSTYQWVGWIPDYNSLNESNDLGIYYRHDGNYAQQQGGIAWTLSFFEGGSSFSTPLTLPGVRLLIYDHDGEAYQSESIRAFTNDGLTGYQLHGNSGIHALDEGDSYRFNARGLGHPETTADGGMILYYQNTSSIRFDMFSTTQPGLPGANNGIFAALDGNLGLTGGSTAGFGELIAVPEPSALILAGAAACGLMLRRDRRKSEVAT